MHFFRVSVLVAFMCNVYILQKTCRWEGSVGFRFLGPLARFRNPLKLSEVNLSCGDTCIFIIIKASTQQGANCLIGWAFV